MAKAERVLDPAAVSNFFRAQIGANKLVRYSLLTEWRRVVKAPDHAPVNLAGVIRLKLDEVGKAPISQLTETAEIRARASCRTDVAKAVGKCVSTHKIGFDPIKAIVLGRAMGAACTSEQ
jgi:chorismate mutase